MKEYFKRITTGAKKWEYVLWWIMRLIMLVAMIETFINPQNHEAKIRTMMIGNFFLTFGWEVMQILPEKCLFRHFPSLVQDFTSVYIVLTAFCGAYTYLNFYYNVWWWDTLLHFMSGGILVMAGYIFMKAYEERDNKTIPVGVIIFASFCASFMFSTFWECWEFSFDQFFGGDTQHWSLALAQGTPRLQHILFQPAPEYMSADWKARFALMDTMTDIVANTLGAVIGVIVLKISLTVAGKKKSSSSEKSTNEEKELTPSL